MLLIPNTDNSKEYDELCARAAQNNWLASIDEDNFAWAFPRKRAVHAGMTGEKVPAGRMMPLFETLQEQERKGTSAVYVHFPYCESRCSYCGFFGGKYSQQSGKTYLESLFWEIETKSKSIAAQSHPIHAVYLGGGTPTALEANELSLLLTTLKNNLPLANDCEITVEGRIHNFTPEKVEACLRAGANRFSLGIQTFNTDIRKLLGRFSSKEEVMKHLKFLASYDQAAIVIDLIYGLPGQSVEDWKDDIKTYLDLPLDGVDLYQLNIFPGTTLYQQVNKGSVRKPAPLHEQGNYFLEGVSLMQKERMRRLSVSHWGRGTRERNLYNPLAKTRADCLHFGSGAGGSLQGYFIMNESNPDAYMDRCTRKEAPVTMMVAPPKEVRVVQTILEQMEHCRLNLDALTEAYTESFWESGMSHAQKLFAPLLDNWEKAGLITQDGAWIELTLAGQFWQVNLTQALLGWQSLLSQETNHVPTH